MVRRYMSLASLLFSIFCFILSSLVAEETKEGLEIKLNDLRLKKAQVTKEYDSELGKINKAADEKLARIKAEFHKKRDECLQDKKDKSDRLREDYEITIKPVIDEEKEILQSMVPQGGMNFAKSKAERQAAKE